jgi:hypothetical protein
MHALIFEAISAIIQGTTKAISELNDLNDRSSRMTEADVEKHVAKIMSDIRTLESKEWAIVRRPR